MAIVKPTVEEVADLAPEQPIMVDSDEQDNYRAILEIERWCRENGLQRIQEQWLRSIPHGRWTGVAPRRLLPSFRGVARLSTGNAGRRRRLA